tara:strand:+ start:2036 stop:2176 length:141 start_codon:yes stop_codon:yes gene_type:complete
MSVVENLGFDSSSLLSSISMNELSILRFRGRQESSLSKGLFGIKLL